MTQTILIKRSAVQGKVPTTSTLQVGELAMNTYDGRLFLHQNNGTDTIKEIGPVYSVAGRVGDIVLSVSDVSGAAPLASPVFTGTPLAPTPAQGTNSTQLATTAFVATAVSTAVSGAVTSFNARTGAVTLNIGDVASALGFTNASSTNLFALATGYNVQLSSTNKASSISLTNNGVTATIGNSQAVVLGNTGASSGNLYFEVTFVSGTNSSNASVGLAPSTELLNSQIGYNDGVGAIGCFQNSGNVYADGTGSSSGSASSFSTVGAVISVAVNISARKVWFRVNGGNWNGSSSNDPATNTGGFSVGGTGALYPALCSDSSSVWNTNFSTNFQYALPSGFTAWYTAATSTYGVDTDTAVGAPVSGQVLTFNGTSWVNQVPAVQTTSPSFTGTMSLTDSSTTDTATFTITSASNYGASIKLVGPGTTTPSKTIRVDSGTLQIMDDAYSTFILSLSDAGALSINNTLSASSANFNSSGLNNTVVIQDTGTSGGNIRLVGNGATTPSKYLRVQSGSFQIMSHSYANTLLTVTDAGNVSSLGTITAGGTLSGTFVKVSVGAGLTAAGTTQATALALTNAVNEVTGGTGGVALPVANSGVQIVVINTTASAINVYVGDAFSQIDSLGTSPYSLAAGAKMRFVATSGTQWYSI